MTLKCAAAENEPICAYLRTLETQYARSNPASKFRFTIKRAITSITQHPAAIRHGSEARQLSGIGDMLEAKITQFLQKNGASGAGTSQSQPSTLGKENGYGHSHEELEGRNTGGDRHAKAPARKARAPKRSNTAPAVLQSAPLPVSSSQQSERDEELALELDGLVFCSQSSTVYSQEWPGEEDGFASAYSQQESASASMDITPAKKPRELPATRRVGEVIELLSSDDEEEAGTHVAPTQHEPESPMLLSPSPSAKRTNRLGGKRKVPSTPVPPEPPLLQDKKISANPSTTTGGGSSISLAQTSKATPGLSYYHGLLRKGDSVPGQDWRVILLIDQRERGNVQVQTTLLEAGVECEVRQLMLGDMLWIVRRQKQGPALLFGKRGPPVEEELVLRYVIERKTSRDLASSIIDGRYAEQKLRLSMSDLDRSIYLVEGSLSHQDAMGVQALRSALATSQVIHQMNILLTDSLEQTISRLCCLHRRIAANFKTFLTRVDEHTRQPSAAWAHSNQCPLAPQVLRFSEYQETSRKGAMMTVKRLFGRQLRQVTGCSAPIAEAILEHFPTPASLAAAMAGKDESSGMALLQAIPVPTRNRGVTPAVAKILYHLFV